jgi:FkbM family methyltransferase
MFLKKILQRAGLYHHLRYSRGFRLYQALFKPGARAEHVKEVRLYREIVGKPGLIFDIGAFDGHKTAAFLEIGGRVVACEPDPSSFRLLQVRFRRLRGQVTLYPFAVTDRIGTGRLFVHHPGSAFNTLDERWVETLEADRGQRWTEPVRFRPGEEVEVHTTTLDDLIRIHGVPEFIKIDAEGSEKKLFEGLHQRVPCVSWECLLPDFRADLHAILQKLMSLDKNTSFNVIHEELLLFPEFVGLAFLLDWLTRTDLFTFDLVART